LTTTHCFDVPTMLCCNSKHFAVNACTECALNTYLACTAKCTNPMVTLVAGISQFGIGDYCIRGSDWIILNLLI